MQVSRQASRLLFEQIFGADWEKLPPVLQKHYTVPPYSDDFVIAKGTLDVTVSPMISVLARLTGMLVADSGKGIPVSVTYRSCRKNVFRLERQFHFPGKSPVTFHSTMEPSSGNQLVEFMRFGIGWKLSYDWDGEKICLCHRGYVWRLFGFVIPIPLSLLIGRGHAEEYALTETSFRMWTHAKHPLFGVTFGYAGEFEITEVSCNSPS
ncbi:DUF4166 domain-containing protein [Kiloniella laminariae]|uniref:DUF4166 domain-containing protein n=1 Tax=Kiloniella laminariae TaxID=454162 RepID=A0ABT4LDS6_9PROT|nr:DUF4166 domain-containing protein [Kiloniella laminariae]MCZ4279248.1 DUF4166 domain-containing protein [Kiloniella laminariae]